MRNFLISLFLVGSFAAFGQNLNTNSTASVNENKSSSEEEFVYRGPISDNTKEGQVQFVLDLLDLAGYVVDKIVVYQNLPNHARVFRVRYNDDTQGGFIFVRWDKKKKENFIDNKRIDAGMYYNLKAAKEIMREQTNKDYFLVEDAALQAADQEKISPEDLEGLRQQYDLDQEEKKLREMEKANKSRKKKRKNLP